MKHLVVQKSKDSNRPLAYKYGTLIGTIQGVLLYGSVGEMEFRSLVKALFAVLDADNTFDRSTMDNIIKAAKEKGIDIVEELG